MKNKVKLAVDLGNGFVKAKSANKELIAPSSMVLTSDVAISQSSLGNDYNTYKVNGAEFIWGVELENPAFIIESSDLISTYSRNSNRYNSKPFKDLFLAVLAELIYNDIDDDEGIDIELITGVPSDDLNDENIEAISNFLAGKHIVTRNRAEDITFKVGKVTVIEQPLGTLLDVAIADNLKINNDIMDQNNIILDFGAGTTSIDTFFKGKFYQNLKQSIVV